MTRSAPGAPPPNNARTRLLLERDSASEQLESLTREFDGIVESSELVASDDEHDPEGHTIAFERQQVPALQRAARSTLIDIDDALSRCDSGNYGGCGLCGRRIADERLDAIPAIRSCIHCASGADGPS